MTVTIDGTSGITYPVGTIQGTGYGPAFSAYNSTTQTVSNNTTTKITLDTEDFDTANCFASSRFTPNVAGYYQLNWGAYCVASTSNTMELFDTYLYKNGSKYETGAYAYAPTARFTDSRSVGSVLVYLNGTTDYVELYARAIGGGTLTTGGVASRLSGSLVRGT